MVLLWSICYFEVIDIFGIIVPCMPLAMLFFKGWFERRVTSNYVNNKRCTENSVTIAPIFNFGNSFAKRKIVQIFNV